MLCLAVLAAFNVLALIPLFLLLGGAHEAFGFLATQVPQFLVEASLTTIVGFAIAARLIDHATPAEPMRLLRSQLFQAAKVVLLQVLVYLLSFRLTAPFYAAHGAAAEIVQTQIYTVLALIALRWSFEDQDARCRHCLRLLAEPSRVGPPSWNFLAFNGTHLACPEGHGLLSIPEIETSWRQSSEWIAQ